MIQLEGSRITIKTKTQNAVLEEGALVSLKARGGEEYISAVDLGKPVLDILYRNGENVRIARSDHCQVRACRLSDHCAALYLHGLEGDGVLTISEDIRTGDICIEPEVIAARKGVRAVRYTISGMNSSLRVVAPFFQGVDMEINDSFIAKRRWIWPHMWEAGLTIFHDGDTGFWVHCEDTEFRSKAVYFEGDRSVTYDTEAWGPVDDSQSAGGLVWRINVFRGGWQTPAARYREWMWKAFNLSKEESLRPDWLKDLKLAVGWCPTNKALLDAIAKRVDPQSVLLHLPFWRSAKYDQCYPDYMPSREFIEFTAYAKQLGFRSMPHANAIDMDPSMPEYRLVCDFKYRDIETERFLGWSLIGMPETNKALAENRDHNVMVKVHPGLAMWRMKLAENLEKALTMLSNMPDALFLDVTLCIYNLANSLVDNTTAMRGMQRLIEQVSLIHGGIPVGGEGLNEVIFRRLSIAQVHLFDYNPSMENMLRLGNCDINAFLFGRLTRTFGYNNLAGKSEYELAFAEAYRQRGIIPTLIVETPEEIDHPNEWVDRILREAADA